MASVWCCEFGSRGVSGGEWEETWFGGYLWWLGGELFPTWQVGKCREWCLVCHGCLCSYVLFILNVLPFWEICCMNWGGEEGGGGGHSRFGGSQVKVSWVTLVIAMLFWISEESAFDRARCRFDMPPLSSSHDISSTGSNMTWRHGGILPPHLATHTYIPVHRMVLLYRRRACIQTPQKVMCRQVASIASIEPMSGNPWRSHQTTYHRPCRKEADTIEMFLTSITPYVHVPPRVHAFTHSWRGEIRTFTLDGGHWLCIGRICFSIHFVSSGAGVASGSCCSDQMNSQLYVARKYKTRPMIGIEMSSSISTEQCKGTRSNYRSLNAPDWMAFSMSSRVTMFSTIW